MIEGLKAGDGAADTILLAVVGSTNATLASEPARVLQRVRAIAADARQAGLDSKPDPNRQAKHAQAGSSRAEASVHKTLELQAQQIAQLEAEKQQLVDEVSRLRKAQVVSGRRAQSPRPECVQVELSDSPVRASADADGALMARRQKQIADLRDLLQRSMLQLDRPVRHLPLSCSPAVTGSSSSSNTLPLVHAADAAIVRAHHEGEIGDRLRLARARVGNLTCSLLWNNTDDLDLHCEAPGSTGNQHIHWRYKKGACGGHLDVVCVPARRLSLILFHVYGSTCCPWICSHECCPVYMQDMNAAHPTANPIENIFWANPPGRTGRASFRCVFLFSVFAFALI